MFTVAAAVNSVQVVNTNANLQSTNNNPYYPNRPNNQVYVSGAVRSYQHGYGYNGYPSSYNQDYYYPSQGYRYRRQIGPIVKEANSQYQYQGANQYDEKVNPLYSYGSENAFPYSDAYKYRENNQYQLQGNTQSRVEGDPSYGNQYSNNRYQSQQQGSLYRQRYQY